MMYTASTLSEDKAHLREAVFTRWLAVDFHQASVDFLKAIGLTPLYMQTDSSMHRRTIFARFPAGGRIAARSGRSEEQFIAYDQQYRAQGLFCLSLHLHPEGGYSAVWCSEEKKVACLALLAEFGISLPKCSTSL